LKLQEALGKKDAVGATQVAAVSDLRGEDRSPYGDFYGRGSSALLFF
jgi:hypothetical protein